MAAVNEMERLIEASSLGAPDAAELRATVSHEEARRIVAASMAIRDDLGSDTSWAAFMAGYSLGHAAAKGMANPPDSWAKLRARWVNWQVDTRTGGVGVTWHDDAMPTVLAENARRRADQDEE